MITNFLPIFEKLTIGTLGPMLAMKKGDDPSADRTVLNTFDIFDRSCVLYIGLDSLTDKNVAFAIGSLALSDIAASAGTLYNFREDKPPINVFIDEAAECVNDSFIQLLNKGRGAGMRLTVAAQTIDDFITALGSASKVQMVLGNINNIISLRVNDENSQNFFC